LEISSPRIYSPRAGRLSDGDTITARHDGKGKEQKFEQAGQNGGFQMQKLNMDTNAYLYPMPVFLVGTMVEGNPNFMTGGWVSRVNSKPPMIATAINKAHYTPKGIGGE
jgi:hypothetical protein